jgi:hypothetical protein
VPPRHDVDAGGQAALLEDKTRLRWRELAQEKIPSIPLQQRLR